MAMPVEQEARIWQTIGIVAWAAGAGMLAVLMKENGVIRVSDTATLSTGIAASFLMLAGIAGTIFGRVMRALQEGYDQQEARLWHLFASVCCACGAFAVIYVAIGHWNKQIVPDLADRGAGRRVPGDGRDRLPAGQPGDAPCRPEARLGQGGRRLSSL